MKAWVATHTGLPSFGFTGTAGAPLIIDASDEAGRTWTAVDVTASGEFQALSDALALPGVPATYHLRGSADPADTVTLTRRAADWSSAVITRRDGRAIEGLAWVKNGDPRAWSSGIQRFGPLLARWPLEDDPITGEGTFFLFEPARQAEVHRLLQRHEPLLLFPGEPAPGLPPRVITVDKFISARRTGDGWLEFSVAWTELPLNSPMLAPPRGRVRSGAGVVTWGEAEILLVTGWRSVTYEELCREIAGMPA